MSSIIACSSPPLAVSTPDTSRGVLSSSDRPMDWASRRAGSMVSTTTLRPRSAARSASAAAVVVLPTPPLPQHTTIRVAGSQRTASRSSRGRLSGAAHGAPIPASRSRSGQLVQPAEVDAVGQEAAARTSAGRGRRRSARLRSSSAHRSACSAASAGQRRGQLAVQAGRRPARRRARRGRSGRPRPRPAPARGSSGGRIMFTITAPTGRPAARSSATASTVSCTGISSSSVTTCTAVCRRAQHRHHPVALRLIGPTLASPATSALTLRKRVMRPVGGASSTTAS